MWTSDDILCKNGGGEQDDLAARCKKVVNSLKVTAEEVWDVDESTRLQSHSRMWFEQRAGRITPSVVHDVLHTGMDAPAKSLIKKICSDTPSKLNVPAMNCGRARSVASGDYLHTMSSRHEDTEVIEAGLSISKASSYVAVSPMALSNVPAMALVCWRLSAMALVCWRLSAHSGLKTVLMRKWFEIKPHAWMKLTL